MKGDVAHNMYPVPFVYQARLSWNARYAPVFKHTFFCVSAYLVVSRGTRVVGMVDFVNNHAVRVGQCISKHGLAVLPVIMCVLLIKLRYCAKHL